MSQTAKQIACFHAEDYQASMEDMTSTSTDLDHFEYAVQSGMIEMRARCIKALEELAGKPGNSIQSALLAVRNIKAK